MSSVVRYERSPRVKEQLNRLSKVVQKAAAAAEEKICEILLG